MKTKMASLGLAGLLAIGAVSASHGAERVGVDGSSVATYEHSAVRAPAIEEIVVYGTRVSFAPDEHELASELREQVRAMHEQLKAAIRVELAELDVEPSPGPTGTDIPLVVNVPQA